MAPKRNAKVARRSSETWTGACVEGFRQVGSSGLSWLGAAWSGDGAHYVLGHLQRPLQQQIYFPAPHNRPSAGRSYSARSLRPPSPRRHAEGVHAAMGDESLRCRRDPTRGKEISRPESEGPQIAVCFASLHSSLLTPKPSESCPRSLHARCGSTLARTPH
eukprot:4647520-Pleurochrysis_carterae.AAC.4